MTAPLLSDWADAGNRLALEDGTVSWSFADLAARAQRWRMGFAAAGLQDGDRVAAWLDASAESIAAMLGVLAGGGCWVPINRRYREGELGHILADSGARWLVVGDDELPPVTGSATLVRLGDGPSAVTHAAAVEPSPDAATSLLIYTSGTTGPSKGVHLPLAAVEAGIGALVRLWRFSALDRLSLALPLFHVHGLCIGVFGSLLSRSAITLHARFDPAQVVADIEGGATVFMGVPTMYVDLLAHLKTHAQDAAILRRARLFTAGSAALRPDVLDAFEAATGHRILERYGMSETLITLSNPYEGPRRAGHVGGPVPGYEVRVVDDDGRDVTRDGTGELWVRGPGLMRGYWRLPEATAAAFTDGWFRTGDVVARGDGDALRIVGRRSTDIIKSGGFKIATGEIEAVLREHPAVADAAVVGVPDDRWGERIAAAVELRAGLERPADLTEALVRRVRSRLADYKTPRQIAVVAALPRNALGKVVKPQLREMLGASDEDGPSRR